MSIDVANAAARFEAYFGFPPEIGVRAPGRVNIIGEHTDYNEGFVLPMAIEREIALLAKGREDRALNAFAANLERNTQADLDRLERDPEQPWIDYVVGVARELELQGRHTTGADLMIIGDVPIGSGLSSSASLEMAALALFETLGGFELPGTEAAKLGQRVENDFLGLNTGIMDQSVVRMGRAGHALFLDCRSHEFELVPVAMGDVVFVIANTGVSRGLTASKYNERVAECNEAVRRMNEALGTKATHLRDFDLSQLHACGESLPDNVLRRARHVISEDQRTKAACDAMGRGAPEELGVLMNASDESLRTDYEVTCAELDAMTEIARGLPGCFGARMTGAGFGGCTINLVASDKAERFGERLLAAYHERVGIDGELIISAPAQGAGPIPL